MNFLNTTWKMRLIKINQWIRTQIHNKKAKQKSRTLTFAIESNENTQHGVNTDVTNNPVNDFFQ